MTPFVLFYFFGFSIKKKNMTLLRYYVLYRHQVFIKCNKVFFESLHGACVTKCTEVTQKNIQNGVVLLLLMF